LGIIFSTLFFLYPELIPILLLVSIPYLFTYFKKQNFSSVIVFISTIVFFFLVNKNVVLNIILNRVGTKLSVLDPIYGFSGTIFMLNRILFGHIDSWNLLTIFSTLLVIFSIINVFLVIKNKEIEKYGIVVTLIFLILLFPLSFSYKYHYFKLFLTISPMIILSFYIFLNRLSKKNTFLNALFFLITFFCLFFTAKGTRNIMRFTYLPGGRSHIGGLYIRENMKLYDMLEKIRGKDILVNGRNSMENAWISYHARNNNVKVTNPDFAMRSVLSASPKIIFSEKDDIKKYDIISTQNYPEIISNNIELYPYFNNTQGLEGDYPNQFSWIGKTAEFGFMSKINKLHGHLLLDFQKGSFNDSITRRFNIYYGKTLLGAGNFNKQRKQFEYPIDIIEGINMLSINTENQVSIKSNSIDLREFNILLSDFKLFICDGNFEKLFYIIPENDGWVTREGFKIIGCVSKNTDDLKINFSQIVELNERYNFSINNISVQSLRKEQTINLMGIRNFVDNNYLSVEIKPEFSRKIDKDPRQLSFFPINYEKN